MTGVTPVTSVAAWLLCMCRMVATHMLHMDFFKTAGAQYLINVNLYNHAL